MNDQIVSGDTLDFIDSVSEFPPSAGWTLKYRLVPRFTTPVQAPVEIVATTAPNDEYRVQAASAVTATWTPGSYTWSRWVEMAGPIRQSLGSGQIRVLQNPATAVQGYDGRSHARKMLDAIEACLESRSTSTQRELVAFTIGVRSQTFDPEDNRSTLLELHSKYKWLVADEEATERLAAGLSNPRNVGIRFGGR